MLKVFSHRVKTHGGFQCVQPRPGTLVWRTPHDSILIVDHTGTHRLGNDHLAHAIWDTAVHINTDTPAPTAETSSATTSDSDDDYYGAWDNYNLASCDQKADRMALIRQRWCW